MSMKGQIGSVFRRAFLGGLMLVFLLPQVAAAATLYIDPSSTELYRGDTRSVAVRLDVDENECVNAVDAVISYDEGIRVIDVSRGDSIFSLWLEDPVIDEAARTVTFAGGIPNGYCGRIQGDPRLTNTIVELVVRAPGFSVGSGDNELANIYFTSQTRAFLNDGRGTEASLATYGTEIFLHKRPGTTTSDTWTAEVGADERPPEPFSIELVQQDDVFSGKYYIVFNTTDKQSGIDHYEVIEERLEDGALFRWGSPTAPWVEAKSPYVLLDQDLRSAIRVKAIDKAGNERIATLVPDEDLQRSYLAINILILVSALAVLCVVVLVILKAIRKRRAAVATEVPKGGDDIE